MLDRKLLNKNLDEIVEKLKIKGFDFPVDEYKKLNEIVKNQIEKIENLQHKRNAITEYIKKNIKYKKDPNIAEQLQNLTQQMKTINMDISENKNILAHNEPLLNNLLLSFPNVPNDNCPHGKDENDNILIKTFKEPTHFDFDIKDHVELGEFYQGLDFQKGTMLAQPRFVVMNDKIAKLHRAIAQFMLDLHTEEHNYKEVNVPVIVNEQTLIGTGQLPKFKEDLFKIQDMNLALIPTAEVPLTNLVRDTILKEDELPIKLTAHSLCFRSEAGSAGRDVRGILRQHQFEKIELVQIVKPEDSENALQEILSHAEKVLQLLELPYRVVELCGGDLGFSSAKTFDIEVWIPSQNTYREISSCSNMTDFQARRLKSRFVNGENKKELVHTLNGSGLAVGRTLMAVMENYQNPDHTITIPHVLRKYFNYREIL